MPATAETIRQLEAQWTAGGIPPLSPFWLAGTTRFYDHPTATLWGARVGRGGSKSTTGCKVAINEALFGDFIVPRGERHYFAIVSENVTEASNRLRQLEEYLRALTVEYDRQGDAIELRDAPRGFRVLACRIGAVSGFRCFGWLADEVSKWRSADSSANPAREVVASMNAMTVTHPRARRMFFSAPLSTLDHHYEVIERGDTSSQIVSIAASWEANPILTEERTHELEDDERVWKREYAAIPSGNLSACFSVEMIDAAFADSPFEMVATSNFILTCDPSGGRRDTWAYGLAAWWGRKWADRDRYLWKPELHRETLEPLPGKFVVQRNEQGHPLLNPAYGTGESVFAITRIGGIEGRFFQNISSERIVESLAEMALPLGVRDVVADSYGNFPLESSFARHGLKLTSIPWNSGNKGEAVMWVSRLMKERRLHLSKHEKLRKELLGFREKILPTGTIQYEGRLHDDYVAIILSAAMADLNGMFRGSPTQMGGGGRQDFGPGDFRGEAA